jgi:hypothetical protein
MREYADELHLASPPLRAQRALFTPLVGVGKLFGYRGWYPKYSTDPPTE